MLNPGCSANQVALPDYEITLQLQVRITEVKKEALETQAELAPLMLKLRCFHESFN